MGKVYKACILVGGPSVGTRFRPLSLDCPKPLFPIAGRPMIYHHIAALATLEEVKEVLIIGFFENSAFDEFLQQVGRDFPRLTVRYLREYQSLGTGGGLYHFRDEILRGSPDAFFCLHADICSSFPLRAMLDFHNSRRETSCSILATTVPPQAAHRFGCLVVESAISSIKEPTSSSTDSDEGAVMHYVEKPESFVSALVSCGVYLFNPNIFAPLANAMARGLDTGLSLSPPTDRVRLEQDVLAPLAGTRKLHVFEAKAPTDFFMQIKTAESALPANRLYLAHARRNGTLPASSQVTFPSSPLECQGSVEIKGDVYIHPSAAVDPSSKLGPNVSVGALVVIGPGVRVKDSILLEGVVVGNDSCIANSIVGWKSKIGAWVRLDGELSDSTATPNSGPGIRVPGATVLGKEVVVHDEVIIRSCIVLPHKELKSSYHNEIVM